jgi:hypothetical protein
MIHFCLVSDQPVPNFLPALVPEIKPTRVVLAVSEGMRNKAGFLIQAFEAHQIQTEIVPVLDPYDLGSLQDVFFDWLDKHADEPVVLNVTGGTKPMAISAQEAFRAAGKDVFYVSPEKDELNWLNAKRPPHVFAKSLSLKNFLLLHGYSILSNKPQTTAPETWKALSAELIRQPEKWKRPLSRLNYYAMRAEQNNTLDAGRPDKEDANWDELMEQLFYNDIIRDRVRLLFHSLTARAFANGGWLEHHIFDIVRSIEGVNSAEMNIQIADPLGNKNEFDVVFLHRNRLIIIECKTKRFAEDKTHVDSPAADAVYKLDALRKTGGLRTKGILISYMPIDDRNKNRAQADGITVIDQGSLPRLKECLQNALK